MTTDARTFHTWHPKGNEIQRDWVVVDAKDQVLGRLATQIAHMLRGKHKPTWSPHVDGGDFVIVRQCRRRRARPAIRPLRKSITTTPAIRVVSKRHPTRS